MKVIPTEIKITCQNYLAHPRDIIFFENVDLPWKRSNKLFLTTIKCHVCHAHWKMLKFNFNYSDVARFMLGQIELQDNTANGSINVLFYNSLCFNLIEIGKLKGLQ